MVRSLRALNVGYCDRAHRAWWLKPGEVVLPGGAQMDRPGCVIHGFSTFQNQTQAYQMKGDGLNCLRLAPARMLYSVGIHGQPIQDSIFAVTVLTAQDLAIGRPASR